MLPRPATLDDVPAINALIARSARDLSVGFYTPAQIEAAVAHVFGVDTQLLADQTYYVIDRPMAWPRPAAGARGARSSAATRRSPRKIHSRPRGRRGAHPGVLRGSTVDTSRACDRALSRLR